MEMTRNMKLDGPLFHLFLFLFFSHICFSEDGVGEFVVLFLIFPFPSRQVVLHSTSYVDDGGRNILFRCDDYLPTRLVSCAAIIPLQAQRHFCSCYLFPSWNYLFSLLILFMIRAFIKPLHTSCLICLLPLPLFFLSVCNPKLRSRSGEAGVPCPTSISRIPFHCSFNSSLCTYSFFDNFSYSVATNTGASGVLVVVECAFCLEITTCCSAIPLH